MIFAANFGMACFCGENRSVEPEKALGAAYFEAGLTKTPSSATAYRSGTKQR